MSTFNEIKNKLICYHCGDICTDDSIFIHDKYFCCNGCKTVYEILNENQLCNYYTLDQNPGISPKINVVRKFDYLNDETIINQLIDFRDENITAVTFIIPQMHCSSCIWLLENLFKINPLINQSKVDFLKKTLNVRFHNQKISLKEVVELLASLGYEPNIQLDNLDKKGSRNKLDKHLLFKIGIAGFCFGNIMLISFPEYLSINPSEVFFRKFFGHLNLLLSLPVFFYSASDYFISAYKGLRKKIVNIDFPISLGIAVLFFRSAYEILTYSGAGYFDSLSGLVFFLLIGKLFQNKTYDALNFERDYKSYFPIAVTVKFGQEEKSKPLSNLKIGDRILIRNNEIIPADSILFNGEGFIDYSFVTGESKPVEKVSGELIYAGGRQAGGLLELEVVKEVSQSYLTQLWNNDSFNKKNESQFTDFSNSVSKYFTAAILLIALVSAAFWFTSGIAASLTVFTSVLIVACPCALALSIPFTFGNTIRIFGKNKFYLKNSAAIEELSKIDEIVFDKTGTITETGKAAVNYVGTELNEFQKEMVKSLVRNSTHTLSKRIYDSIETDKVFNVSNYMEISGKGLEGIVLGSKIKLGSKNFVINDDEFSSEKSEIVNSLIFLSINDEVLGYFAVSNSYRSGLDKTMKTLAENYSLYLLSGDNNSEIVNLKKYFPNEEKLFFNQSPASKLEFIKNQRLKNKNILMIGDGLNDAGALSQSNIGISVTDNIHSFSPACDAILQGSKLNMIDKFIQFAKTSTKIINISFVISFLYNIVGLSFAVQGMLSPIVAAILMPISSISVVIFVTSSTNYFARKRGLLSQ